MISRNIYKTYLAAVKNSIGSKTFRNFWVVDGKKKFDAMRNGELSCAFFVSGILTMFGLIERIHGTVASTISDLEKSGWQKVRRPRIGSILVWEKQLFGIEEHSHIGFYIGGSRAISNNVRKGFPARHNWQFDGKRKVIAIYWKEIK